MISLDKTKTIYFVGIGGIGMSAVAGIARAKGFEVSGSDDKDIYDPSKSVLDRFGITYKIGYAKENILLAFNSQKPDLVVATSAVDQSNPEIAWCLANNLKVHSYPELLGALSADKKRIVVVGTHGKGTTAGLIAHVLKNLRDDSFFIGAVLNDLQTNFYYGYGKGFVIEGDEYVSSSFDRTPKFMYYHPTLLLINNLEFDHPDVYKNLDAMKKAFKELVDQMSADSLLVYNADDQNVADVVSDFKGKKFGFGFNSNTDIKATMPILNANNFEFGIECSAGKFNLETIFPGLVYAYDNLAAFSVFYAVGADLQKSLECIKTYRGVKRRFEIISDGQYTIIDDYAHHPTAVKQTLQATKLKYPKRRIVCFFEPHTYSRTKETFNELVHSFDSADLVFIAEVYPARELKLPSSITGTEVVAEISKTHDNVFYVADKKHALESYLKLVKPGDVIVVMAVGSFNTLVYDLKEVLH